MTLNVMIAQATPEVTALNVAEYLLSETERALLQRDFRTFATCYALPLVIETYAGTETISTTKSLRRSFDTVCRHLDSENVTVLDRRCIAAEYTAPDEVHFAHETRMLNGSQIVRDPYPAFSVVRLQGNAWRVVRSTYATDDSAYFIRPLTA